MRLAPGTGKDRDAPQFLEHAQRLGFCHRTKPQDKIFQCLRKDSTQTNKNNRTEGLIALEPDNDLGKARVHCLYQHLLRRRTAGRCCTGRDLCVGLFNRFVTRNTQNHTTAVTFVHHFRRRRFQCHRPVQSGSCADCRLGG